MSLVVAPKNCDPSVRQAIQKLALKLGPTSEPTFAGLTLTGFTASRLVATDADKAFESTDIAAWVLQGSANQVVVTDENDGTITLSLPQNIHAGAIPTFAGLISTGIIQATDFAKTGWPLTPGVTLSFSNDSPPGDMPTFTVTDDDSAYYYIDGVKYVLGGNKTVDITDTEGLWYIYFDGATLTALQTIWSFLDEDKALVAILYWDATNNKEIFLGYEAHTFHMSGSTHARLHYAGGTRWETGLLVSDAGSQLINVSAGDIWDEDLNIPISDEGGGLFSQVLSPAQLPIYYRDGATNWRIYETDEKAIVTDAGYVDVSDDLKYNKLNGTWANATVGLNNYVAYWVIATNEQTEPIALIMGQRFDNKISDAKENNIFGGLDLTGLPFQEMVVLARLILKGTGSGVFYTLEEVLDLRALSIGGNITSPLITQHAGLGGLDFASAGHTGFQAQGNVLDDLNTLGAVGADSEFLVGTAAGVLDWESGATARTSLGLGDMALQNKASIDIDGGAIDGVTIGTNSPCTELQVDGINIDGDIISRTGNIYIDFNNGAGNDLVIHTEGDAGGFLILESSEGIVINDAWTATGQTCADLGTVTLGALGAGVTQTEWDAAYSHSIGTGSDHALLSQTPGTVEASKAVIVDASKDIDFDGGDITTTGTGRFDGGLAVGTAVQSDVGILSKPTLTSNADYYGLYSQPIITMSDDAVLTDFRAIFANIVRKGTYESDRLIAIEANVTLEETVGVAGTLDEMKGIFIQLVAASIGGVSTINSMIGLQLAPPSIYQATPTLAKAIDLSDFSSVGTTSWAIYSAGGDSYHAGDIILEDTTNKDVSIGSDNAGYLDLKAPTGIRANANFDITGTIRTTADQDWDLGAASAQADFAGDTKIRVTIGGSDYDIVAKAA